MIAETVQINASGKGDEKWRPITGVHIGYDHPFHIDIEHAVTLDFVPSNPAGCERIALELDRESARSLAEKILEILDGPAAEIESAS